MHPRARVPAHARHMAAGGDAATLHALLATRGTRAALAAMLQSLGEALGSRDHVTVVCDGATSVADPTAQAALERALAAAASDADAPSVAVHYEPACLGHWGHGVRNAYTPARLGHPRDFLWHVDDDDVVDPAALAAVRAAVRAADPASERPHVIRVGGPAWWAAVHAHAGVRTRVFCTPSVLLPWRLAQALHERDPASGRSLVAVGPPRALPRYVIPRGGPVPRWEPRYGGDGAYWEAALLLLRRWGITPVFHVGPEDPLVYRVLSSSLIHS